jgi:hypothetical protein
MRATERESGYLCTFSTATSSGSTWVRAWDAHQARELTRLQLRDAGFSAEVAVQVVEAPANRAPRRRSRQARSPRER